MNFANKKIYSSLLILCLCSNVHAETTKKVTLQSVPNDISGYYPFLKQYYASTGSVPDLLGFQTYKTAGGLDIENEFTGQSLPLSITCNDSTGCFGYSMSIYGSSFIIRNKNNKPILEASLTNRGGYYEKLVDSYLKNYQQADVTTAVSSYFSPSQNIPIDRPVGYGKPIVTLFLNIPSLKQQDRILSLKTNQSQVLTQSHPIDSPVMTTAGVTYKLLNSVAATSCTPDGNVSVKYSETKGAEYSTQQSLTLEVGMSATVEAGEEILGAGAKMSATVEAKVQSMFGTTISSSVTKSAQTQYSTSLGANHSGVVAVYQAYNTLGIKSPLLDSLLQSANNTYTNSILLGLGGNTKTVDGSQIGTTFPIEDGQQLANLSYVAWITGACN